MLRSAIDGTSISVPIKKRSVPIAWQGWGNAVNLQQKKKK
jgi:hypothetical protein